MFDRSSDVAAVILVRIVNGSPVIKCLWSAEKLPHFWPISRNRLDISMSVKASLSRYQISLSLDSAQFSAYYLETAKISSLPEILIRNA